MQAIPAVQIVPQGNDAASPAASNSKATDFKTLLESSIAGTDSPGDPRNLKPLVTADLKDTLPAAKSKADKLSDPQDIRSLLAAKSKEDKLPAADPGPASLQALIGKAHEAPHSSSKIESKAKPAQAPDTALPTALPVGIPLPTATDSAKGVKGNADSSGKAPVSGNTPLPADTSASARSSAVAVNSQPADKPADIAPTGNILPPKTAKIEAPSAGKENPVGKESVSKTADQPINQTPFPVDMKPVTRLTVAAPVASPAWGNEIGQKIVWMSATDHHVAELHLNPPNLGPMEIKLTVHNDQATIQFVSHHQDVRAALESALPRLREMMMDNGIALGNATVDSGSYQQSAYSRQDRPRQQQVFLSSQPVSMPIRASRLIGAVDTFA